MSLPILAPHRGLGSLAPNTLIAQARDLFDTWGTLTEPAPETQRAAAFALAPYLQRAADTMLPELDLAAWQAAEALVPQHGLS